jgi:hypothetical protein
MISDFAERPVAAGAAWPMGCRPLVAASSRCPGGPAIRLDGRWWRHGQWGADPDRPGVAKPLRGRWRRRNERRCIPSTAALNASSALPMGHAGGLLGSSADGPGGVVWPTGSRRQEAC